EGDAVLDEAVVLGSDEVRVVDEHAAFVQVRLVQLVCFLVESDQDVAAVSQRVDRAVGDADLEPGVAALDLRRVGAEGERAKAQPGGGYSEVLAGADHAADGGISTDAYYEIVSWHSLTPRCYSGSFPAAN